MIGPSQGDCLGIPEYHLLMGSAGFQQYVWLMLGMKWKCWGTGQVLPRQLDIVFMSFLPLSVWLMLKYKIKRTIVVIMKKENKRAGKAIKQNVVVVEPDSRIFERILSSYVV